MHKTLHMSACMHKTLERFGSVEQYQIHFMDNLSFPRARYVQVLEGMWPPQIFKCVLVVKFVVP